MPAISAAPVKSSAMARAFNMDNESIPSAVMAIRSPICRHLRRVLQRIKQTRIARGSLAGLVEGGAVIDGDAKDRHAKRDVDPVDALPRVALRIEAEAAHLDGDVALVVIHGHADVVRAAVRFGEEGVGG